MQHGLITSRRSLQRRDRQSNVMCLSVRVDILRTGDGDSDALFLAKLIFVELLLRSDGVVMASLRCPLPDEA